MDVLVVAAHADDEALGCGGAMARHAAEGDAVRVLFLADGVTSRGSSSDVELDARMEAARRACRLLGSNPPHFAGMPDNQLDSVPLLQVVQQVERVVSEYTPDVVYTHHAGDLNVDHRITQQAVMTACRPQPGARVRRILGFEVPSSTEWQTPGATSFEPNWFVDISAHLAMKLRALEEYREEMRDWPHARSIRAVENLARWRGATVGREAAEAFMLARSVV